MFIQSNFRNIIYYHFDKNSLNKEIDDFSKINELLHEKILMEKKKKQNKKERIKRKNKINEFRIINGLPNDMKYMVILLNKKNKEIVLD